MNLKTNMIADPSTREGRIVMIKEGYNEREIGKMYNDLRGFRVVTGSLLSTNWDSCS